MNLGSFKVTGRLGALAWCAFQLSAVAQMPGGAGPTGMSSALTKLFGTNTAFSAKGEMLVTDNAKHEVAFWPMDFSLLDRKIRVEIDLTQTRSKDMPAGASATLKAIGMSQIISIIRPDKGVVYVIYPDQKVLLGMPLPKDDVEGSPKGPKIAKKSMGQETVDGHPCVKNKVTVTDSSGQVTEAITWDATDLKNLPIQIETQEKETTSTIRFRQVQFDRPSSAFFEPPGGFTQYDDPEALKMAVMKKMMDDAGKK